MTGTQGPSRTVTRRTVVAAVGGAGLAAVALTACGGSDDTSSDTGSDTVSGGQDGGQAGKELAKTADIPEGGGKIVGDVVITQPKPGEFKAFSSKCTHQGCAVKDIADGVIVCPCHGSKFDASDGSVKAGPATTPLPSTAIKVDGTSITLA
ncbi:Rieske (2Fe-2S) protein [Streptomyces sp. NPDC020681]|uniref:Rieske (2Fe-2S) protein n=1 Tax=Streptomyces sp. NPDC020681 TaxID=3365083 RepID=UPI0037B678AC